MTENKKKKTIYKSQCKKIELKIYMCILGGIYSHTPPHTHSRIHTHMYVHEYIHMQKQDMELYCKIVNDKEFTIDN